jgi:hypothetical protein
MTGKKTIRTLRFVVDRDRIENIILRQAGSSCESGILLCNKQSELSGHYMF